MTSSDANLQGWYLKSLPVIIAHSDDNKCGVARMACNNNMETLSTCIGAGVDRECWLHPHLRVHMAEFLRAGVEYNPVHIENYYIARHLKAIPALSKFNKSAWEVFPSLSSAKAIMIERLIRPETAADGQTAQVVVIKRGTRAVLLSRAEFQMTFEDIDNYMNDSSVVVMSNNIVHVSGSRQIQYAAEWYNQTAPDEHWVTRLGMFKSNFAFMSVEKPSPGVVLRPFSLSGSYDPRVF